MFRRTVLFSLLMAAGVAAPRAARADARDIKNQANSLAQAASTLYSGDSASIIGVENCQKEYARTIEAGGTDGYRFALLYDVKTPQVSWKEGDQHTVGELKALCDQADKELKSAALVRDLTSAAVEVINYAGEVDERNTRSCLAAYDKIHAAGLPDSQPAPIKSAGSSNPLKNGAHTVGELHTYCQTKLAAFQAKEALGAASGKVIGAAADVLQQTKHADDSPQADLNMLKGMTEKCNQVVDEVLAGGTPPDTVIEVHGGSEVYPWKGPLSKVKDEVCARAESTLKKKYDERIGPYVKAGLKGDKLRYIEQNFPGGYWLPGGAYSDYGETDPKKLAKANVWISISYGEDCARGKTYIFHRYTFDKNQNVAKETVKSYCGDPGKKALQ
jgi:hypothetical protein